MLEKETRIKNLLEQNRNFWNSIKPSILEPSGTLCNLQKPSGTV